MVPEIARPMKGWSAEPCGRADGNRIKRGSRPETCHPNLGLQWVRSANFKPLWRSECLALPESWPIRVARGVDGAPQEAVISLLEHTLPGRDSQICTRGL